MTNHLSHILLRFAIFIPLQVLVLNHILIGGFLNPQLYVYFIITLPFEMSIFTVLFLGFATGLTIDFFTGTLGLHASALLLTAYLRQYMFKVFEPRVGYDDFATPSLQKHGFNWFISYVGALLVIHHVYLFFIESFQIAEFGMILTRALLSAVFTFILIMISEFVSFR